MSDDWKYEMISPTNYVHITCGQPGGDNLRGYCGEDNARLIVAAPKLLVALKELRDWYIENTGLPAVNANRAIALAGPVKDTNEGRSNG